MNIYVVVEGKGDKKVYTHWIPLVNRQMSVVNSVASVKRNNFLIVSGGGYPNYFEVIKNGVTDVVTNEFLHRLVVAVDSEDATAEDKSKEIQDFIEENLERNRARIDYRVIIQHFCLETWALGNKVIVTKNPQDPLLRRYKNRFNVAVSDPEMLPPLPKESLNRAQFAEKYLRLLVQEKYKKLYYTKSDPYVLRNDKYFDRVKGRFTTTGHIASFENFLNAFN